MDRRMAKALSRRSIYRLGVGIVLLGTAGCIPSAPAECGQNIESVVSMDFSGPGTIEAIQGGVVTAAYDVTVTITKVDPDFSGQLCFLVWDKDTLIFDIFAPDDFLVGGTVFVGSGGDPGPQVQVQSDAFQLETLHKKIGGPWSQVEIPIICGHPFHPNMPSGCSNETKAEVYILLYGPPGLGIIDFGSPIHQVEAVD